MVTAEQTPPSGPAEPRDYTVRLDRVFSGPMDLLLHLVREQEVEIHEIEISTILRGYLEHLKRLAELDIEDAADFVLMAATLMAVKSRSLIPSEEVDLAEELDPRDELIQRLVEYRRFRYASEELEHRWHERWKLVERGWRGEVEESQAEPLLDLGDVQAWDLLGIWSRLQREIAAHRPHRVQGDPRPIRWYVDHVVDELKRGGRFTLRGLVGHERQDTTAPERELVIGSFCAILELVKLGLVTVDQDDPRGDLDVALRPEHTDDLDAVLAQAVLDDAPEEGEAPDDPEAVAAALESARATAPDASAETAPAESSAEPSKEPSTQAPSEPPDAPEPPTEPS